MKILMMTDLEGVSGVVSFVDQGYADGRYHERAKKLLTAEVNAVVDGLLAAGATDVLVIDGHGPGGMCFEDLHPRARMLHGKWPPWTQMAGIFGEFDAGILVGQHAMAGAATGTMNHTQNSRAVEYYKLNDRLIGETAQFALFCGGIGLPTIFLSGDDAACREAEALIPEITAVSVKQGITRGCAISVSIEESHRRLREGAAQAVEKHKRQPLAPLVWEGPFVLEKRFFTTGLAEHAVHGPGSQRVDGRTVRLASDDILEIIYA